jgi:DNA polymerase
MLVGEYWGEDERRHQAPFMGASGMELNRMLHDAGVMRSECYATNLFNAVPPWGFKGVATTKKELTAAHQAFGPKMVLPEFTAALIRLNREISLVQPNVIITLGTEPTLALTQKWGIARWRGSQLTSSLGVKVIPTYNPAAVLREFSLRPTVVHDLRRAARERATKEYTNVPQWRFNIRPSAEGSLKVLGDLLAQVDSGALSWIDFDLETAYGHITCAGLSWSRTEAISIPFTTGFLGYFNAEEEAAVVYALYRLLTHPRVKVRGQNLLYDAQYTWRHWHFVPRVAQDTMITFHTCYAGMRKSLDFQASLLCDHYVQWKPDRENWKEGG